MDCKNVDVPGGFHSKYDAYHNGEFVATVHLSVPGEHNVLNSLCAFAAAYESGADVESICEGLQAFKGAGRRFELLGKYNGITFADDYAHHPKELKVTLEAAMKMDLIVFGQFTSLLLIQEHQFFLMILLKFFKFLMNVLFLQLWVAGKLTQSALRQKIWLIKYREVFNLIHLMKLRIMFLKCKTG